MWRPLADLEPFNKLLVQLEQALLAVFRKTGALDQLLSNPELDQLFELIDAHPYQALLMARIKAGHAMTPRHGLNVMLTCRAWAVTSHRLGRRLRDFCLAALLHDLGHWRPDDLVYVFDHFSHDEHRRLREHPHLQEEILLSSEALVWIAQHHEQPDGRGYPEGIKNPELLSQMIRIVDCYDGLTSARRFRPAYTPFAAMTLMERWAGYKYDAGLFQSFLEFMGGLHPIGATVRLKTGSLAAMLPISYPQLQGLLLTNNDGDPLSTPEVISLELSSIAGEGRQWHQVTFPEGWQNLRPDSLNLPRFYG